MFIKDQNAQEGYIHICEGKTEKQMRLKGLEILKHDIHHHTFVYGPNKNTPLLVNLQFCPYCGVNLDQDESKN